MRRPSPKAIESLTQRLAALSERLRRCDEDFSQATDYLLLIATHPNPPEHVRDLSSLLVEALHAKVRPEDAAHALRTAVRVTRKPSTISPLLHGLHIVLRELAIDLDDQPRERLGLIRAYARHWESPFEIEQASPPRLPAPSLRGREGSPRGLETAWAPHVNALCAMAMRCRIDERQTDMLLLDDLHACLHGLRLAYGTLGRTLTGARAQSDDLMRDFRDYGEPLWDWLAARILASPAHRVIGTLFESEAQLDMAKQVLMLGLTTGGPSVSTVAALDTEGTGSAQAQAATPTPGAHHAGLTLVVCRQPIAPATDRCDRAEVDQHRVLELPLPVVPMPPPQALEACLARLTEEFPWAESVIDLYVGRLIGLAKFGTRRFHAPPTLLWGEPGSGKTRLAMRLAEELGLPALLIPAGGNGDSKLLSGTARGWASGRPGEVPAFMVRNACASPAVIVDEIDKAGSITINDRGLQPYLLGLLEPQTAAKHRDSFLLTDCDLSAVTWLATANRLGGVGDVLISRFELLHVPQPRSEHYTAIARRVAQEFAEQMGIPREALPDLDPLFRRLRQLESARAVRRFTIAELAAWARSICRH